MYVQRIWKTPTIVMKNASYTRTTANRLRILKTDRINKITRSKTMMYLRVFIRDGNTEGAFRSEMNPHLFFLIAILI
jgi:hypothetical protein